MNNKAKAQVPGKHSRPQPGKPENKNNLDSRKNEEQDDKGDGTTHNHKEHHSDAAKSKSSH